MATLKEVTLCLCGDVMLGRGIDQILPYPGEPTLYENYVKSATGYVHLAERLSGPIPRKCDFDYVWGDALADLAAQHPDARIVNLETSVTTSLSPLPKGINYKMHPNNLPALKAAAIDCCVLANNHLLDWGREGLEETLEVIHDAGIVTAGAGRNQEEAEAPAILPMPGGRRLLVFAAGSTTSGIPDDWTASEAKSGVSLLPDLSRKTASTLAERIAAVRQPNDVVVVSIHWGSNWGYHVPSEQRGFAHTLIDAGACDVLHGHSSHHPRPIEIYRRRPILYGCGDFITDYEGIGGMEEFRGDLAVMYLVRLKANGALATLTLRVYRIRRFRLERASSADVDWLQTTLQRESAPFGTRVACRDSQLLVLSETDDLANVTA